MIFDFKFWHYFVRQGQLIHNLDNSEMRYFNKRLAWLFALGVLLFALREIWGMNTATLTPYLVIGDMDTYTLARWISLFGTLVWAGIYLAFHTYGAAYLFSRLLEIPWRAALVMQTYVTAVLVIEKALLFFLFAVLGYATSLSVFSFGPLAAMVFDHPFIILTFNQLTVFTSLIIAIQYRFLRNYVEYSPKLLLFGLIMLHFIIAVAIGALSFVPLAEMLEGFTEGVVPGE
ncbi:hypothetical protein [Planococcus sp. CAU13]|uniref:hypothetical protein n=1 Tax=Planococcus sp. CAU13 TaxID=1541197 RepID=UPI0005300011|nr:hypothetical protein [Planococcus sp. CAU13]